VIDFTAWKQINNNTKRERAVMREVMGADKQNVLGQFSTTISNAAFNTIDYLPTDFAGSDSVLHKFSLEDKKSLTPASLLSLGVHDRPVLLFSVGACLSAYQGNGEKFRNSQFTQSPSPIFCVTPDWNKPFPFTEKLQKEENHRKQRVKEMVKHEEAAILKLEDQEDSGSEAFLNFLEDDDESEEMQKDTKKDVSPPSSESVTETTEEKQDPPPPEEIPPEAKSPNSSLGCSVEVPPRAISTDIIQNQEIPSDDVTRQSSIEYTKPGTAREEKKEEKIEEKDSEKSPKKTEKNSEIYEKRSSTHALKKSPNSEKGKHRHSKSNKQRSASVDKEEDLVRRGSSRKKVTPKVEPVENGVSEKIVDKAAETEQKS